MDFWVTPVAIQLIPNPPIKSLFLQFKGNHVVRDPVKGHRGEADW